MPPSDELVRAELARVLASAEFQATPQLSAFLRYIVEAKLDGQAHLLKGQNVGVAVLGRAPGFDAQRDPIVRVEAHRLRRTLAAYYAGAGAEDRIRLVVERGSYVPRFDWADVNGNGTEAEPPPDAPNRGHWLPILGALVLVGLGIIGLVIADRSAGPTTSDVPVAVSPPSVSVDGEEPPMPAVKVERFERPPSGQVNQRVDQLASDLTIALARFPELRVIADPDQSADFQLEGEVTVSGGVATVAFRLAALATSEVIWSTAVELPITDFLEGDGLDRLVEGATIAIAPQFGAIARYLGGRDGNTQLRSADDYRCLIEAQLHTGRMDDGSWQRLDTCLRDMLVAYPDFADGLASQALLYLAAYRREPDAGRAAMLFATAETAARHALEREPANVRAMWAVQSVSFHKGDLDAAQRMGERALAANPFDPLLRAQQALVLLTAGDAERAWTEAQEGQSLDPAHVATYDALDFLARLEMGTLSDATAEPVAADVASTPYEAVARLIALDHAGQVPEREKAVQDLKAVAPLFATDRHAALARLFPDTPFAVSLDSALAKAGIGDRAQP
ncbi:hypothetical protein OSH11_21780 [Kaistia dalseonensis]|uniref:Tetratricopeptide (TPR) repeat protein n=1 Tax=Kaistia dalseonensis TaxID=410840 RepID=A0ABU0HCI3_9HYPH|nr:hypothetical protein [Kaistia dalseonensis]MCX5497343.1 hypothetical protein [Kaistia dalseonensis]MDQ0439980.1 tetratricopeptide (TPR) repeat protein [Kaistia dalseonensis]